MADNHDIPPDKAGGANADSPHTGRKKYVTRACDSCKARKSKCNGNEPCSRCLTSGIDCAYNTAYHRVPRRRQSSGWKGKRRAPARSVPARPDGTPRQQSTETPSAPTETQHWIEDSGDASVHAFLRRVSGHLAQVGQGLPRSLFKREQDALSSPDDLQTVVLPSKELAREYVDCYFEHSNVTYRYLPRADIYELFERMYEEDETMLSNHTDVAKMFLVIGMGCIWMASWKKRPLAPFRTKASVANALSQSIQSHLQSKRRSFLRAAQSRLRKLQDVFPPTLGLLQAFLTYVKCQLELGSSRFNSAWMTLGMAVRLAQVIDLHKADNSSSPLEAYCRRSLFWAMFMIDRYLAVTLGRPMAINENDVTITFSSELDQTILERFGPQEGRINAGAVAHARLTKILGSAISKLYPANTTLSEDNEAVPQLQRELQEWLRQTPIFFHPGHNGTDTPNDQFYDIPWTLLRQQKTVRAAYYFVNMVVYRRFLLAEFLHQAPTTPRSGPTSEYVNLCVENAIAMAKLADSTATDDYQYNASFWTTSYFIFCSISILLVYLTLYQDSPDRQEIESVIERAMQVHDRLDNSASIKAQRLLEESLSRAENAREANLQAPNVPSTGPVPSRPRGSRVTSSADMCEDPTQEQPQNMPEEYQHVGSDLAGMEWNHNAAYEVTNVLDTMPDFEGINSFDMIMDIGFGSNAVLDSLEEGQAPPF